MRLLAVLAFAIAAIIALAGIKGITVEQVIGIIALGLAFLALCGPWDDPVFTRFRRV